MIPSQIINNFFFDSFYFTNTDNSVQQPVSSRPSPQFTILSNNQMPIQLFNDFETPIRS
jgi:hypothetical protein